MNFDNPDKILKILLSMDEDYEEIDGLCRELCLEIPILHTKMSGKEFPTAVTQCILECFKEKNNFTSSIWCQAEKISSNKVKNGEKPVKFTRKGVRGDFLDYELYNLNQIIEKECANIEKSEQKQEQKQKSEEKPPQKEIIQEIKEEAPVYEIEPCNIDTKQIIISFINEFNGQYGRAGVTKILKGSKSLKDNEFNSKPLKSKYFGILKKSTLANITAEIDKLIEEKILITKKVNYGFPVLCLAPNIENTVLINTDNCSDKNIKTILKLIKEKHNLFITGHAGTGKSYILNKIKENIPKLTITSTTGIAAVNVKGQTIHSFTGVGICNHSVEETVKKILKKASIKNQIQKCKILAVDEISMLDIKAFEYIDAVLRKIREIDEPYGGIQLIFIGDFFQLPPSNNNEEERKYCFESNLWQDLNFSTILLTENHRQNEKNLIQALSNMRINALTKDDIQLFKTRECIEDDKLSDVLHIFATNLEADNYNSYKFNNIKTQEYILTATDGVYKGEDFLENPEDERDINILKRIDTLCTAEKNISLKIGVRVMLLVNLNFDEGLINGSCGSVEDITNNYILVKFDNGKIFKITKHDFEFYNNDKLIAIRKQFPLRLAYGITIHKSQGMSLDKLVVDCSRIFEKGQAYVALSRIKSLNGLYLHGFCPSKVMTDEKVVNFYKNLKISN